MDFPKYNFEKPKQKINQSTDTKAQFLTIPSLLGPSAVHVQKIPHHMEEEKLAYVHHISLK
jgi:hypothetical protein